MSEGKTEWRNCICLVGRGIRDEGEDKERKKYNKISYRLILIRNYFLGKFNVVEN